MRDVTTILSEAAASGDGAVDELLPLLQTELRGLAEGLLRREAPGHTLQPTALLNEAYLKMVDQTRASFNDRVHFLAVAARVMRRILVDHARGKRAIKRGGQSERNALEPWSVETQGKPVDLLALDDALAKLERTRPRAMRVVEMRFFGGLSVGQAAAVLGVGTATVEREWRLAKAVLHCELNDG